ncbi:MAG: ATP synthase F1 subunit epsilon [Acidobacteria bacterium]|nr:MAG: ATP synthase F1 subunit epsilon [Acidobacteriota bacterium]
MNALKLEILTPEKAVLNEEAMQVELQGEYGRLGILPEHTSLIAKLDFGILEYTKADKEIKKILCGKGVLEINNNHIMVLVDSAEDPENIDVNRAEEAKKRAEERLKSKDSKIDTYRAELALKRAIQRIQFSQRK